uniref:DNA-directed RNA polymerase n=1 Tax=Ditylenchus dipsaci TaxID=166011 RepID=A0A915D6G0_9BILA
MQRRLVKCLEDLAVNYDGTVRTSAGEIVQFTFGEDGLDPAFMEGNDGAIVNFNHILGHARNTSDREPQVATTNELIEYMNDVVVRKLTKMPPKFGRDMEEFLRHDVANLKPYYDLPSQCEKHCGKKVLARAKCSACDGARTARESLIRANCLSFSQISAFVDMCALKVKRAIVEPGTAVGAIAATSIGEPSTQMTLKTFHFAGVASMNITQGVPRIKEVINAVKNISTPVITVALSNSQDEKLGRRVKARLEKTTLGEISDFVEQVFLQDDIFVVVKLNSKRIRLLQLEITLNSVIESICSAKLPVSVKQFQISTIGNTILVIKPPESDKCSTTMAMHYLKQYLPNVAIKGLQNVNRCVIHADEKTGKSFTLLVDGTNFKEVLATGEIDGCKTNFNNASVVSEVLGIEAARSSIINEILSTMKNHSIDLDRRHVMLLADLMTYRGEVLGITRNGLVKMKESVLLLASFERTTDHLYEAAFFGQKDNIVGVSECIILGTPMLIGTGMFNSPPLIQPHFLVTLKIHSYLLALYLSHCPPIIWSCEPDNESICKFVFEGRVYTPRQLIAKHICVGSVLVHCVVLCHPFDSLVKMDHTFFEPQPPKLEAIIYAEFDNDICRVIKYQIPHAIFDKRTKTRSMPEKYIQHVFYCGRGKEAGKTTKHDVKVPDGSEWELWCRNALISARCWRRCSFLSEDSFRLPSLMKHIFFGLNNKGECIHKVTDQTTIYLKLSPSFHGKEPPPVNPF